MITRFDSAPLQLTSWVKPWVKNLMSEANLVFGSTLSPKELFAKNNFDAKMRF
jgi:hypothetical protein